MFKHGHKLSLQAGHKLSFKHGHKLVHGTERNGLTKKQLTLGMKSCVSNAHVGERNSIELEGEK